MVSSQSYKLDDIITPISGHCQSQSQIIATCTTPYHQRRGKMFGTFLCLFWRHCLSHLSMLLWPSHWVTQTTVGSEGGPGQEATQLCEGYDPEDLMLPEVTVANKNAAWGIWRARKRRITTQDPKSLKQHYIPSSGDSSSGNSSFEK